MATVPQLQEKARGLGLKFTSKTRKPELEQMIAEAHFAKVAEAVAQESTPQPAESDSKAVNTTDVPTQPESVDKALAARTAGAMGKSAKPTNNAARHANYVDQNWARMRRDWPTARQERRMRKHENRAKGRAQKVSA